MAIELILICKDEGQIGGIGFILENIKNWKMWEIYLKANALQIVLIPNGGGKKKKNRNWFFISEKDKFIFGVNSGEIVGGGEFGMNVEWVWIRTSK